MTYQKITDLFIATSADYNPKSDEAYTFFKKIYISSTDEFFNKYLEEINNVGKSGDVNLITDEK